VTTATISERFAGPPFAVNGGYAAGLLAERAGIRAAHVQLRAQVPLETPVEVAPTFRGPRYHIAAELA
jgi:hypothetical protein